MAPNNAKHVLAGIPKSFFLFSVHVCVCTCFSKLIIDLFADIKTRAMNGNSNTRDDKEQSSSPFIEFCKAIGGDGYKNQGHNRIEQIYTRKDCVLHIKIPWPMG